MQKSILTKHIPPLSPLLLNIGWETTLGNGDTSKEPVEEFFVISYGQPKAIILVFLLSLAAFHPTQTPQHQETLLQCRQGHQH